MKWKLHFNTTLGNSSDALHRRRRFKNVTTNCHKTHKIVIIWGNISWPASNSYVHFTEALQQFIWQVIISTIQCLYYFFLQCIKLLLFTRCHFSWTEMVMCISIGCAGHLNPPRQETQQISHSKTLKSLTTSLYW